MKIDSKHLLSLAAVVLVVLAITAIVVYALTADRQAVRKTDDSLSPENLMANVTFNCASGLSLQAAFYDGRAQAATIAGEPPIPGGKLQLIFSDGRQIVLPQTISADGARYANTDESLVFWDKGDEATFYQAGQAADTCLVDRN